MKQYIDYNDIFDKNFDKYNQIYQKVIENINTFSNVLIIERKKETTPYEIITKIIKKYIENINYKTLTITIEGESKIYRRINNLNIAFATMKPSVYSFTHKRYDNVKDTDIARNGIFEIIGTKLNKSFNKFKFNNKNYSMRLLNFYGEELSKVKKDIFVSNFLLKIDNNTSLVIFENTIPNIEIIWKRKHTGTPKHRLLKIDKFQTRSGYYIKPEEYYKQPIIRFDWRNPIEHDKNGNLIDKGDECISEEFADLYINTNNSKILTSFVSWWLFKYFEEYNLELIDLCYFQNENGTRIHSEISPDGMRLKYNGEDMDKDLWRKGKDKSILTKRWFELLNILHKY